MRRRQSTQILDLESRLDQLVSENRLLATAKITAEKGLEDAAYEQNRRSSALSEAIETRDLQLREKDAEIAQLKELLQRLQQEVSRLSGVNHDLTEANISLNSNEDERWHSLQAEHSATTKELEELRQQHGELSTGMEEIVRQEINTALEEKNAELQRLRNELDIAKEQVRTLQQEILASKPKDNFLVTRDEDYFDNACQELCKHVQQWVLRFSKFSDMTPCHLAAEIADEKVVDRFENAILDGSDVDNYLSDRVKRRDVFMSVVMTMIWEYIFTRYLFGMDREQRQKLKSLEKTLSEVGSSSLPFSHLSKLQPQKLTFLLDRSTLRNLPLARHNPNPPLPTTHLHHPTHPRHRSRRPRNLQHPLSLPPSTPPPRNPNPRFPTQRPPFRRLPRNRNAHPTRGIHHAPAPPTGIRYSRRPSEESLFQR